MTQRELGKTYIELCTWAAIIPGRNYNNMAHDPDYQRVARRMREEEIAARPKIITAKEKNKIKRRAKAKASRKARKKSK